MKENTLYLALNYIFVNIFSALWPYIFPQCIGYIERCYIYKGKEQMDVRLEKCFIAYVSRKYLMASCVSLEKNFF